MGIDATTVAALSSDNAEIQARWDQFFQFANQQIESQNAQAEGSFWTQMAYHQAGKAAENAMQYMADWKQSFNQNIENEHAKSLGFDAPNTNTEMFGSYGSGGNSHWDVVGDMFSEPDFQSPQDAIDQAYGAKDQAEKA